MPTPHARPCLTVRQPGLLTTVQDLGRPGWQRYGINVGGAMDAVALRVANLLVGNPETAAGLEMTLLGPVLQFETDALVAITGGHLGATIGGEPMPLWRALHIRPGAEIRFGPPVSGCRAYLALAGGIDVPEVLGSRTTHLRARFGGLEGRALKSGDALQTYPLSARAHRVMRSLSQRERGRPFAATAWTWPLEQREAVVRVMPGTHADRLREESRRTLFSTSWLVTPQSDRMGYRLAGATLELTPAGELTSDAVTAGTVQLPPQGQPIVLMADRPTTGGYPRIAQVITVDLPHVAQLKPGDRFNFEETTLERAQQLWLAREGALERTKARLAAALV